jgi:hypothetical protein
MPGALKTSTSNEVLAGLVDRVTFHNSENGFCVLCGEARGKRNLITAIGHATMISASDFVPFTQQVGMQNPALLALGGTMASISTVLPIAVSPPPMSEHSRCSR